MTCITRWFNAYLVINDFVERISGLGGDFLKITFPWQCLCLCVHVSAHVYMCWRWGTEHVKIPPPSPPLCPISAAFITFSFWFSLQGLHEEKLCSTFKKRLNTSECSFSWSLWPWHSGNLGLLLGPQPPPSQTSWCIQGTTSVQRELGRGPVPPSEEGGVLLESLLVVVVLYL